MRTKHFLFTLAVGAAFAACSSEEDFNVADNTGIDAKLSIRPIADVSMVLTDGDANTRLEIGDNFRPKFSLNDKVGAAVIDIPNYEDAEGRDELDLLAAYNIVEGYGCNNAFSTTDGGTNFVSEQPMVEGNYLFYAPYKADLALRSPLAVKLPREQNASSRKSALNDFYKSGEVVRVGYNFIKGKEKTMVVTPMYDIFAYPKFTIKNNFDGYLFDKIAEGTESTTQFNGTLHVKEIQLVNVNGNKTAKNNFVVGGTLKHSAANTTAVAAAAAGPSVIKALHTKTDGFTTDGTWTVERNMLGAKTIDLLSDNKTKLETKDNGVITTLKVNQDIAQGAQLDINAVMPAYMFNYNDDRLMARVIVTINGNDYVIGEGGFDAGATKAKLLANTTDGYSFTAKGNKGLNSLTFVSGQQLPAEAMEINETTNKIQLKPNNVGANLFTIELTGGKPAATEVNGIQIASLVDKVVDGIKTTEDLIATINAAPNGTSWKEDAKDVDSEKAFVLAATNTVEINKSLIDCLFDKNEHVKPVFKLSSVLPIANDVKITVVDASAKTVTFEGSTGKSYTFTLEGMVTTATADAEYILVNTDITADATNFTEKDVVIVSDKTLTVNAAIALKSLHVMKAATNPATTPKVDATSAKITATNVRNDGDFIAKAGLVATTLNEGTMTLGGKFEGELTNNKDITVGVAEAIIPVKFGKGTVTMQSATTSSKVTVAATATQDVIYVKASTAQTDDFKAAAAIASVNVFEATGTLTFVTDDETNFGKIKRIKAAGDISFKDNNYDMTGFDIELTKDLNCTGTASPLSVVNGIKFSGNYTVTLKTISITNGVKGAGTTVIADGTNDTWNGGASN